MRQRVPLCYRDPKVTCPKPQYNSRIRDEYECILAGLPSEQYRDTSPPLKTLKPKALEAMASGLAQTLINVLAVLHRTIQVNDQLGPSC